MKQPPVVSLADHELICQISEGSYGEVWLARSELGAYRAIKIVRRTRFETDRPFQREYEGIKKFEPISRRHEALVDILHVGKGPGPESFYYIMELADDVTLGPAIDPDRYQARTLTSDLAGQGPLSVQQCIQIGVQLCRGLSFIHERGLIHRDVKPSNVIFVGGQAKLADIGLITGIDDAKTYVGTDGFIPPEGPNSPQADIYSLGKLLYEITTGKDRHDFPVFPDRDEFSQEFLELNEVLVKACHTDPHSRYRSATAMAAELEVLASGKSVRRLHYLEGKVQMLRRWWAPVAAVLTIAGLLYQQVSQSHQRTREERAALVGSKVGQGTALLQAGDNLGALPFFLEGLRLSGGDEAATLTHRLRIGSTLATSPAIKWTRKMPDSPVRWCAVRGNIALATLERRCSQVIDLETGRDLSARLGEKCSPEFAGFMPGSDEIVTANWDETVRVFDWKTGETVLTLPHAENVFSAAASPDGRRILSGSQNGSVMLWECQTLSSREIGKHQDAVFSVKFNHDGTWAVSTSADATAFLWNLATGDKPLKLQHRNRVYSADFSPDGQLVATASYDREVRLWEVRTGQELPPPLQHPQAVFGVQFSPDGELILSSCLDGVARLWSRRTHQLIEANHTLRHSASLLDGCFAGSADQVLAAGADGSLTLWALNRAPHPTPLGKAPRTPRSPARQSPQGKWIVERGPGEVVVRGAGTSGSTTFAVKNHACPLVFSTVENRLAALDGTNVHLVDLERRTVRDLKHPQPVTFADFSPDGLKLVCASKDASLEKRSAQLWDAVSGKPIGHPLQHGDGILYAAFSPDSETVITASEDFSAVLWKAASGERISGKLVHQEKVRYAAFARTLPWVVTASDDGTAIIWDRKTGDQLTPPFRHSKEILRAEFNDDQTALITTDDDDNRWKWDLAIDRRPLRELADQISSLTGEAPFPH